jgi:hypothetical protein
MNYKITQIDKNQARKLVSQIVKSSVSSLVFSRHALNELENDDLSTADAMNVLKSPDAKILSDGELSNGTYRYRVETAYIMVVIAFSEDGKKIIIVTAWDKRKKGS